MLFRFIPDTKEVTEYDKIQKVFIIQSIYGF